MTRYIVRCLTKSILRGDLVVDCVLHASRIDTLGGWGGTTKEILGSLQSDGGGDIGQV